MNDQPILPRRMDVLRETFPVVAGIVLGVAMVGVLFGGRQTDYTQLALGAETNSVFAKKHGSHTHGINGSQLRDCVTAWRTQGAPPMVLWLGNSQLHGVNQYQDGQQSAPGLLFDSLSPRGAYVLAASPPNANAQEHAIIFDYFRRVAPPRVVAVGVCFDDFRNDAIRDDLLGLQQIDQAYAVSSTPTSKPAAEAAPEQPVPTADADLAGLRETPQEVVETYLNDALKEYWSLWRLRSEARGKLFLWLYELRNTALGITAQTARKMIRPTYRKNFDALETILATARRENIRVLMYIVPIRNDIAMPYVPAEYAVFKEELRDRVESGGGHYVDLETLVPAKYWGYKDSTNTSGQRELDFMHFQHAGHKLLAEALAKQIVPLLQKDGAK